MSDIKSSVMWPNRLESNIFPSQMQTSFCRPHHSTWGHHFLSQRVSLYSISIVEWYREKDAQELIKERTRDFFEIMLCNTPISLLVWKNHNSQPGAIKELFLAAASFSSNDYVLVDVHPGQVVGAGRLVDERDVEGGLPPEVELEVTCKKCRSM